MMRMVSRILMGVFCPVWSVCVCANGQIMNSEARMVVPEASNGLAELPLINAYNPDRLISRKKASCGVQYDSQGIVFAFSLPCPSDYKPNGSTVRDDNRIWSESDRRVEVFLQPKKGAAFFHYIINSAGGIYDEHGTNPGWNGNVEVKRSIENKILRISLRIPFSDIGFNPEQEGSLYGNTVVESLAPEDKYSVTWTAVGPTFVNPSAFGEWTLSKTKPFITQFDVSPVNYDKTGASILLKYTLDNPADKETSVTTEAKDVRIPARGRKTFTEKVKLRTGKRPVVTFHVKDVFNYRHQVTNRLVPDVQFVALDWNTVNIRIRNIAYLQKYAKVVRVQRDGEKIFLGPLEKLEEKKVNIGSWAVGDHSIEFSFLNSNGKPIIVSQAEVHTIKPKRVDGDIATLDVSKYYKPITFQNDRLGVARSEFDLSDGILPKQIVVNGKPILASPIAIRFDGKTLPIAKDIKVIQDNKNQFKLTSTGKSGDKTVTVKADHEYDGFVWYDVSIKGGQPFEYGPLEIVIPLELGKDILIGQTGPFSDRQFVNDTITGVAYTKETRGSWDLLKQATLDFPMVNCISVATDADEQYRGLCFISEGVKGWNLKNYDKVYHIEKGENGKATLTVRVSDGATRWKRDEIKFSFGIEPFPMRHYPKEFHGYYRLDNCFDPNNYKERYEKDKKKELAFFENLRQIGVNTEVVFENWTEYQNYWKAGAFREEDMQAYVKAAHEAKMNVIFYFGFLVSNMIPEFTLYHELMLHKNTNQTHNPDKKYFQPYMFYKFGDPDQVAYGQCPNTLWDEHWLAGIEEAVSHYDMDGVYLDGTLSSSYCMNTKHGCGVRDPYGRLIPSYPVRQVRRRAEVLFAIGQKKNHDFMMDVHINEPCAPFMGLVSAIYPGEAQHLFEPKYSRMNPDQLRGWLNGRLFGVPCDLLLRPPYHLDIGWAQALLVDTYIRSCSGGGPVWNSITKRMWGLYEEYGMTADTFTPFFSSKNRVKTNNPDVYVSYYDTPKALILVVSNYMQEKENKVTLDLKDFAIGDTADCKDVWRGGTKFEILNKKVTLSVPGLSLRLLVVSK